MKYVLIAWFVVSGETAGSAVSAEFDSMQACEQAGQILEDERGGRGKNVKWRYVCSPK